MKDIKSEIYDEKPVRKEKKKSIIRVLLRNLRQLFSLRGNGKI